MTKSNPQGGVTKPRSAARRVSSLSMKSQVLSLPAGTAADQDRARQDLAEQGETVGLQDPGNQRLECAVDVAPRRLQILPPRWHSRPFEPRSRVDGVGSLTRPYTSRNFTSQTAEGAPPDRCGSVGPVLSKADIEAIQRNAVELVRANIWRQQAITWAMLYACLSRKPDVFGEHRVEMKASPPCSTRQAMHQSQHALALDQARALHRRLRGAPLLLKDWCAKAIPRMVMVDGSPTKIERPGDDVKCAACTRDCPRKRNNL